MATVTNFQDFSEQLTKGVHQFDTHTFKLFLSNVAPSATNTVLTDITQIAYTNIGGAAPTVTVAESETGGTTTVTAVSLTLTATGTVPTFRYYGIYNDTATNKNLVCFWDHGSAVDLINANDTFSVKFNNVAVGSPGTIFTLA